MAKENKDAFYKVGKAAFRRSLTDWKLWEVLAGHGTGPRGEGAVIVNGGITRGKEARNLAEELDKKMQAGEKFIEPAKEAAPVPPVQESLVVPGEDVEVEIVDPPIERGY